MNHQPLAADAQQKKGQHEPDDAIGTGEQGAANACHNQDTRRHRAQIKPIHEPPEPDQAGCATDSRQTVEQAGCRIAQPELGAHLTAEQGNDKGLPDAGEPCQQGAKAEKSPVVENESPITQGRSTCTAQAMHHKRQMSAARRRRRSPGGRQIHRFWPRLNDTGLPDDS